MKMGRGKIPFPLIFEEKSIFELSSAIIAKNIKKIHPLPK